MLPPSYDEAVNGSSRPYPTNPNYKPRESFSAPRQSYPPIATVEPLPEVNVTSSGPHPQGDFAAHGFSSRAIRHGFIRKVYLLLMVQLSITIAAVCAFQFIVPLRKWVQSNWWFFILSFIVFLIVYIVLLCCKNFRRRFPYNYIAVLIFTIAFSYVTAALASYYNTLIVLCCLGITAALCLALSLFAIQTRIDFTLALGLALGFAVVVIFTGLFVGIVWRIDQGTGRILQIVYGGLAGLLFCLFLVIDTQLIVGGRKYDLNPEEYVMGALQLYLDIVNIFLIMLSLSGSSR